MARNPTQNLSLGELRTKYTDNFFFDSEHTYQGDYDKATAELKDYVELLKASDADRREISIATKLLVHAIYFKRLGEGEKKDETLREYPFELVREMQETDPEYIESDRIVELLSQEIKHQNTGMRVMGDPYIFSTNKIFLPNEKPFGVGDSNNSHIARYANQSSPPDLVGKWWTNTQPIEGLVQDNILPLKTLEGKVVMLDFWHIWCGPCVEEIPHIQKIWDDYKNRGLIVIGVHSVLPIETEEIEEFVRKNEITFPIVLNKGQGFWNESIGNPYGILAVPQQWLIDKHGRVRAERMSPMGSIGDWELFLKDWNPEVSIEGLLKE